MKRPPTFLTILALGLLASSCKKEVPETTTPPAKPANNGKSVSAVGSSDNAESSNWIREFKSISNEEQRLETLSDKLAIGADNLEDIVAAALDDPSPEVRREAMQAFSNIDDARSVKLLTKASSDADEFVRDYAMTSIRRLPDELVMQAYATTVTSPEADVRGKTIKNLANMQNHAGFELMLDAIKDADPDALEQVNLQSNALVGQTFTNYQEATSWWEANRTRFDESLQLSDE